MIHSEQTTRGAWHDVHDPAIHPGSASRGCPVDTGKVHGPRHEVTADPAIPNDDPVGRIIRQRKWARDNLPGWKLTPRDTGIVHGPRHWYETSWTTSGARSGWDAVPDTRDVRPDYPRTVDGRTVWACCESAIGPDCRHRQ